MDSIGQGLGFHALLYFSYRFCYRLIGQQHEFLNEFIGILRYLEISLDGFAFLIDVEVQLLAIELYRAVLKACCSQFLGECVELNQFCGVLALVGTLLGGRGGRLACSVLYAIVFENLLYFLVGITTIALDDGVCQVPFLNVSLVIHLENHAVAEFFLVGAQ